MLHYVSRENSILEVEVTNMLGNALVLVVFTLSLGVSFFFVLVISGIISLFPLACFKVSLVFFMNLSILCAKYGSCSLSLSV